MRYNIYKKLSTINNEDVIYNPIGVNWNEFNWTRGYYPHRLSKIEIMRPYLLSQNYYGTAIYEDIIMLLNGIIDMEPIPVGTMIKIPKLSDLQNFIQVNKQ